MRWKTVGGVIFSIILFGAQQAAAIPTLQLDIAGGYYDEVSETIMAPSNDFTLYALLTIGPDDTPEKIAALLGDTYYLSVAVTPQVSAATDLGSFTLTSPAPITPSIPVDGSDGYAVTDEMVYGYAPIDSDLTTKGLAGHDIFQTYYLEFSFLFNAANFMTPSYDAQEKYLDPNYVADSGTTAFLTAFNVNTANLSGDYALHFDLYSVDPEGKIELFAPFSHDAQSTSVPEPATMLLLGTGLAGITGMMRRKRA